MKTETVGKHTPGPWEINIELINGAVGFDRVVFYSIREPRGSEHINVEHHANARLIAAAPDLLEAAKACEGWFHGDSKNGVAIKLRAAIAKAERGGK